MALVVHKYGGSSVADAEKIKNVARRIANVREKGIDEVAVVSAMGNWSDELIDLAHSVSFNPHPRDLDLLLSTGELVSSTLLTMALADLGQEAVSLTGSQAGIHTDTSYGRALINRVDTARMEASSVSPFWIFLESGVCVMVVCGLVTNLANCLVDGLLRRK